MSTDSRVTIRFSREDRKLLERAARLKRLQPSTFACMVLMEEVMRMLEDLEEEREAVLAPARVSAS